MTDDERALLLMVAESLAWRSGQQDSDLHYVRAGASFIRQAILRIDPTYPVTQTPPGYLEFVAQWEKEHK